MKTLNKIIKSINSFAQWLFVPFIAFMLAYFLTLIR